MALAMIHHLSTALSALQQCLVSPPGAAFPPSQHNSKGGDPHYHPILPLCVCYCLLLTPMPVAPVIPLSPSPFSCRQSNVWPMSRVSWALGWPHDLVPTAPTPKVESKGAHRHRGKPIGWWGEGVSEWCIGEPTLNGGTSKSTVKELTLVLPEVTNQGRCFTTGGSVWSGRDLSPDGGKMHSGWSEWNSCPSSNQCCVCPCLRPSADPDHGSRSRT